VPRRPYPRHALLFLAWGLVPVTLAVAGLARAPGRPRSLAVAAFALGWVLTGVALLRRAPAAGRSALALTLVAWTLAAAQTVRRLAFVARTGRLEGADGVGSPTAFLLGLAVEQLVFFVPLTVLGGILWRARPRRP
jgi:hypothetical protein